LKLLLQLFALPCLLASSAFAQYGDVVVNTGGAVNCVTVKGETGFDAATWTIGGVVATGNTGSTVTVSYPNLTDLIITKRLDTCSNQILNNFVASKTFPSVVLTQYSYATQASPAFPMVVVTLSNAILNNYTIVGSEGAHPAETLDFTYSKVCVKNYTLTSSGTQGSSTQVCYSPYSHLVTGS